MNMDKDEALRLIKAAQLMLLGEDNQPISDLYYALQIAIDSIEELTPQGDAISREALLKSIREYAEPSSKLSDVFSKGITECACEVLDIIDNAPTVEPRIEYGKDGQPYKLSMTNGKEYDRPQGEWEDVICEKGGFYHATCSNCKIRNDIPPVDFAHFCPNCGADMRGGAK